MYQMNGRTSEAIVRYGPRSPMPNPMPHIVKSRKEAVLTIAFLGPFDAATGGEMVSRRRILSRSRDDLTQAFATQVEEEEDVWYQKDKLYKQQQANEVVIAACNAQSLGNFLHINHEVVEPPAPPLAMFTPEFTIIP
ncbi:hypothetical protein RR46_12090 [Papilio xuthus]|uniref:Uncharacterized protein n=1 Tax=Papilio xuthus TaxID=66420 RepID=A0A194PNT1_PAPXU|nr:hypothetical protein RR46_12090 [Papilio xuthus]